MASDFVDETGQHIPVEFQQESLFKRFFSSIKEKVTK
jgi:hypothetical protein